MATDKPRFSITVSDDIYQQINEYQHEHRLATQTKAVLAFIEKGLEVVQKEKKPPAGVIEVERSYVCQNEDGSSPIEQSPSTAETAPRNRNAPLYSSEAMKLAADYDKRMDDWGRKQIRCVADNEIARYEEQQGVTPSTTKLRIAARDGSRMEAEVDSDITLPEEDSQFPR